MSALDALIRCFADDGVCIRDIYANELAEARAELAALREEVDRRADSASIADYLNTALRENNAEEVSGTTLAHVRNGIDLLVFANMKKLRTAVLAERERCAKIADAYGWEGRPRHNGPYEEGAYDAGDSIASAIRSQPKKE